MGEEGGVGKSPCLSLDLGVGGPVTAGDGDLAPLGDAAGDGDLAPLGDAAGDGDLAPRGDAASDGDRAKTGGRKSWCLYSSQFLDFLPSPNF